MELTKYVNSGSIRSLHHILQAWTENLEKYLRYFGYRDNPWWYNERATLSCLAAAVWASDGIALEEYRTEKGKHFESWKGRCDLFIGAVGESFACEAKHVWCAVGRTAENGRAVAEAGLKDACADARKLTKDEGRRLGLCFAVPYLPDRDKGHIESQLMLWLKDLQNSTEYSCVAWSFPEKARQHASSNGKFHPGVVLLVNEVYRQV